MTEQDQVTVTLGGREFVLGDGDSLRYTPCVPLSRPPIIGHTRKRPDGHMVYTVHRARDRKERRDDEE